MSFTVCSQLAFGKTMFKGIYSLSQPPGQEGFTIGNLTRRVYKPEEGCGKNLPRPSLRFLSGIETFHTFPQTKTLSSSAWSVFSKLPARITKLPELVSDRKSLLPSRGPGPARPEDAPAASPHGSSASPHGSSAPQGPPRAPRHGDFHTSSRSDT